MRWWWAAFLMIDVGTFCVSKEQRTLPDKPPTDEPTSFQTSNSWASFRIEHLPRLRDKRWILILHRPTHSLVDSFLALGIHVVRIYAPEHGLFGEKAAGLQVGDTVYRGIPVVSLYGQRKAPPPEELRLGDAVLFALRDVGVRYYTYLSTLSLTLQAAAQAQRPVWLLDFPNLHAHYAYGAILDSGLFSFVGMHATPLVAGLTIGEYAQMLIGQRWLPPVELHVIPWKGWRRTMPLPTDAPFFTEPPSPAMRSVMGMELYPILGWYEGTHEISVGRGTDYPFEQVGIVKKYPLPIGDTVIYGYRLRVVEFQPTGDKRTYHGWRITRLYPGPVRPDSLFRLGFFLLKKFREATGYGQGFYRADFFDKLFGTAALRQLEKESVEALYRRFAVPQAWHLLRTKYLLYE